MTTRTVSDELVELDRPFAEFFRTLTSPWPFRPLLALAPGKHFIPTADVFARNGDLVVRMDLPGMDPKDIHVKFVEEELTVTGERRFDKEVEEEGYYRKESSYGTFERHISLPKAIKETDIKAEYDNGVLEISVPRAAGTNGKALAKTIPVEAATPVKPATPVKAPTPVKV
jgi:HSP20 family protein